MTPLSLYNQDSTDEAEFVDNFVARATTLSLVLNDLRHLVRGGETEHQLLVGMRGMGKTSMLRRIAIAVSTDPELKKALIPLRFREEQYNVLTLDTLWRNCGDSLAEWCEINGHLELVSRIDSAVASPEWRDAEVAFAGFLGFCAELGRRPCLLIDNLDLILDNLQKDGWILRNALQREDGPIVVGASTQFLKQAGDRSAPFYEFFHPILLEPLSEDELMQCVQSLADRRGDAGKPVRQVLENSPERIRTLYTLTGGNPRVLALIYRLLEQDKSDLILDDLSSLLDEVTPFYKARVEEFQSAQQRAIIDNIALNWDPVTSGNLSDTTGIPVTTISSQLKRLRETSFIQRVEMSGSYSGYQISERFLNIWYLMRHGTRRAKQRLRWLTIFLARLFSEDELRRMAALADAQGLHNDFQLSVKEAYIESQFFKPKSITSMEVREEDEDLLSVDRAESGEYWISQVLNLIEEQRYTEAVSFMEDLESRSDTAISAQGKANILLEKSIVLGLSRRHEEALVSLDKSLALYEEGDSIQNYPFVARALACKCISLNATAQHELAVSVSREVTTLFREHSDLITQETALAALMQRAIAFDSLQQSDEEIAAYDEIIGYFENSEIPAAIESVARSWRNKAVILSKTDRIPEAIQTYEEMISFFDDCDLPSVQVEVASAWTNMAVALGRSNKPDDEIRAYDDFLARMSDLPNPELHVQLSKALLYKAISFGDLQRTDQEIAAYDELISKYADSDNDDILLNVARGWLNKALIYSQLERSADEISTYGDLISRMSDIKSPEVQAILAKAMLNQGMTFGQLGDSDAELATLNNLIEKFGGSESAATTVAKALFVKARAFSRLDRIEDEIAVSQLFMAEYSNNISLEIQNLLPKALVNTMINFGRLERYQEILDSVESMRNAMKPAKPFDQVTEGRIAYFSGLALIGLERWSEAFSSLSLVAARFGADYPDDLQEEVATAWRYMGQSLGELRRYDEQLEHYEKMISTFDERLTDWSSKTVSGAMLGRGRTLIRLERDAEALEAFNELLNRFEGHLDDEVQTYVASAFSAKGRLLFHRLASYDQAEEALKRALANRADFTDSANLIWTYIAQGRADDADELKVSLKFQSPEGLALVEAGVDIARDNLGNAVDYLDRALGHELKEDGNPYFEDLLWLLRIAVSKGYGKHMLDWFERSGNDERYSPIYSALFATVNGEQALLDLNPELRATTQRIYRVIATANGKLP